MNERQKRFADEYIICGIARQAAIAAGYTDKYAKVYAHKLLANVRIKEYIDQRLKELESEKIANQTEVLQFLTAAMRGEVTEPVAVLDGSGSQKIVELRPSVNTRKAAAELLGKRYRLFTEKQEVDVQAQVVFLNDDDIKD